MGSEDADDVRVKHERMKRVLGIDANDDIAPARIGIVELFEKGGILGTAGNNFRRFFNIFAGFDGRIPKVSIDLGRNNLEIVLCTFQSI